MAHSRTTQISLLSEICRHNVQSLRKALNYVVTHRIGAFRILSPLFPLFTHPSIHYQLDELPDAELIRKESAAIRAFRQTHDIRLSFHPDQFNVLSSPRREVINNTSRELAYHGLLAELVDAEVINLHAGGVYDDKDAALHRLRGTLKMLPDFVKSRITLENDDISYTPKDLLPLCEAEKIPMVYDIHHHRCLPDGFSEEEATERVVSLWHSLDREPYFHISSPKHGWNSKTPRVHADYIDPADFPPCWQGLTATVDVEAKAKELAVLKLQNDLREIDQCTP